MLSVLIPTYNYNVYPLVEELHKQCIAAAIAYEILVFDDGSGGFISENSRISNLPGCRFETLQENIGRSKIRNLLGKSAAYNHLLFLDADVMPVRNDFIWQYVKEIDATEKVVAGGLRYRDDRPETTKMLRWTYGREREAVPAEKRREKPYQRLLASNFMISKSLFERVGFEENMPDLRREDTLFSYQLMQAKAAIHHIENPVYHDGLDNFDVAIRKEHQSLEGLKLMLDKKLLPPDYFGLASLYNNLRSTGFHRPVAWIFQKSRNRMIENLSSPQPSLIVFDLYRIGYLCSL